MVIYKISTYIKGSIYKVNIYNKNSLFSKHEFLFREQAAS